MIYTTAVKFYGYSGCGTCRKAKNWLSERNIAFKEIAIRETPPSKTELKRMLGHLDGETKRLLNTSSKDYRELGGKAHFGALSNEELFATLIANGNLIKRPFVLTKEGGAVGFSPEVWLSKFG